MNDIVKLKAAVEGLSYSIENAADLVQLIEEDVEDDFFHDSVPNSVRARAGIVLSAMYVLRDQLTHLSQEAAALANEPREA